MSELVTDELTEVAARTFCAAHGDGEDACAIWHYEVKAAIEAVAPLVAARVIEECARIAYFSSEEAARYIRDEVPKRLGIGE